MNEHTHGETARASPDDAARRYLMVPGLGGSGPDHWQSRWCRQHANCATVALDCWDEPNRRTWIGAIDAAVRATPGKIVLIGHSLGCIAVAWWAITAAPNLLAKVDGAMLVAPPDLNHQGVDLRLLRFAPAPTRPLPFRALVVASANDPYSTLLRAAALARSWHSAFESCGYAGHINAASGLGDWLAGQALLAGLIEEAQMG